MSSLRDAAQAALEALESSRVFVTSREKIKHPEGTEWYDERITALRAALAQEQAEPTGKQDLQVESVATVAENATTQQRVGDAPPSDYRRGYWDGFAIGKREGRIEAEDAALAQEQAEPLNLRDPAVQRRLAAQWGYVPAAQAEPVEPVAVVATQSDVWRGYNGQWAPPGEPIKMVQMLRDLPTGTLLYTAPPQRTMVPLTEGEIDAEWHELDGEASALFKRVIRKFARGIEKASWEKNNG